MHCCCISGHKELTYPFSSLSWVPRKDWDSGEKKGTTWKASIAADLSYTQGCDQSFLIPWHIWAASLTLLNHFSKPGFPWSLWLRLWGSVSVERLNPLACSWQAAFLLKQTVPRDPSGSKMGKAALVSYRWYTKAQKCQVTHPRSHSSLNMPELRFKELLNTGLSMPSVPQGKGPTPQIGPTFPILGRATHSSTLC